MNRARSATPLHDPGSPGGVRRLRRLCGVGVGVAVVGLVGAGVAAVPALTANAATADQTAGSPSPVGIPGRGATVPFVEQEAEDAATNGTVIGPDRTYGHLPSEASGREAVTLDAVGEYVEFTLTKPANAADFRYSIPDNASGTGRDATLDLEVNGTKVQDLPVTSRYGWFYGGYPFSNSVGDNPHHFYDEVRTMFSSTLPVGTKVRLQVSSTAASPSFTIDLGDFEQVAAPIAQPAGSLNVVTDFGADPTGATDATQAIQAAVNAGAAQGKTVYVPEGRFKVTDHVILDKVTLTGAGQWYSVLTGNRVGLYGKDASAGGSHDVTVSNLAIFGEVKERNDSDQVNGFGGAMSDSTIDSVWIQHTKVGAWMDGPMDHLTIENSRILDQTADGINFHLGVTNSTATNNFIRNTGDDGIAEWAEQPEHDNTFTYNTIVAPVLANNIAIYGGTDITVSHNVVSDTVTNGGGIHIANRYPGVQGAAAIGGTITADSNTLIRAGNSDYNWQFGVGAMWFDGLNEAVNATIDVSNTDIIDSSYEAIQFIEGGTKTVHFTNVDIDGTGTFAIQAQATFAATFEGVTARHIGYSNAIYSCQGAVNTGITLVGSGNTGWYTDSPYCGPWPAPNYVYTGGGTTDPTDPPTTPTDPTDPPTTPTDPTACVGTGDVARGKTVVESSHVQTYSGSNAVDGDAATYWESANNAFPQSLRVDLCAPVALTKVVLGLPASWEKRSQTLKLEGSSDGSSWSTLAASKSYAFDPASASDTVTIPVSGTARYVRVTVTANTGWPAAQLSRFEVYGTADDGVTPTAPPTDDPTDDPTAPPTDPTGTDLALGKTVAAGHADVYVASNAVDGDANSYWESPDGAFPQSITVDLGASKSVSRLVLQLPPATAWAARTQTLSVLGSTDGSTFQTLEASAGYRFDPASGNTVTVTFPASDARYVRLTFTGNTGWPAAQLSELGVYAS
ncbi:glycosyl hydrolase family 28-related protein [Luteimicrobium xylanilyticum]|uniref:Chitosanase n=1 Tax=Luteimicrobium xylanilyticum TaxID=1133546 RepID=A0A5P9Q760_9MICO|nr:discoidin domain-containing protein [Luteimicrobium xylanilyticum]QFU96912.1 Chitosanase [Luteimicrobium xylanilyticum]